jgi:hypothetical protein
MRIRTLLAAAFVLAAGRSVAAQDWHGRVQFRTDVDQAFRDAREQGRAIWLLGSASW